MRTHFLVCTIVLLMFSQLANADEASPQPGAACSDPGAVYNYSTNVVKTPWTLNELYALPVGTTDPATWNSSSDFRTQFINQLGSGSTPQAYAQACGAVWQNFFDSNASVLFNAKRTVTSTIVTLQCTSGVWTAVSSEDFQINDVSDWLTPGSGSYVVTDSASVTQLQQDLQAVLLNLNAQPGATN